MPRTMTVEELQELGRRYYKLKQYEQAREAFTQALEVAPSVSLYDHRAASYDKLGDHNAAVKDGREMIKLDKKDIRGYLRTASVLEKIEKDEVALGIYKYGMRNVPMNDKNFKVLQQLHDKLTRKLSPAQSIDPLTVFPVELAEMILDHLNFRQRMGAMRVSRGWRDYIGKLPRLWSHLDLSGARRPVPRSFVDKAVRRSRNQLTRITINRFEHVDMLVNIAKSCKDLSELDLVSLPHTMSSTLVTIVRHARNLRKLVIRPDIKVDTAVQLLHSGTSLEYVSISPNIVGRPAPDWKGPFPNLRSLAIEPGINSTTQSFNLRSLLRQTPSLEALTVTDSLTLFDNEFTALPLTSLILKQVVMASTFPIFPASLCMLVIECTGISSRIIRDHLLPSSLPQLQHLHLAGADILSADLLEAFLDYNREEAGDVQLLKSAQPLKSLMLRGTLKHPAAGLFNGTNSLCGRSPRMLTPSLETLDVSALPCNDDEVEALVGYGLGLLSINLSSTQITGASIKMLADKTPTLKSINADYCPRINGRDAIEYARRKGIIVSCSMHEAKGGRKIRY